VAIPASTVLYNEYVLVDSNATKDNILNALKDIAAKASARDYFIFNFNGRSGPLTFDSVNYTTYFYPYRAGGYTDDFFRAGKKTENISTQMSRAVNFTERSPGVYPIDPG
jgi:hypothetical protein